MPTPAKLCQISAVSVARSFQRSQTKKKTPPRGGVLLVKLKEGLRLELATNHSSQTDQASSQKAQ
jgi:hypothetical protein